MAQSQAMWLRRYRELVEEVRRGRREDYDRWLAEWRARVAAEDAADRRRDAEQRRRFGDIDAAMENDKQVTRAMILQLREQTVLLHDMRHGIQATTEGLLRVLDEMRREDGPSGAGA